MLPLKPNMRETFQYQLKVRVDAVMVAQEVSYHLLLKPTPLV